MDRMKNPATQFTKPIYMAIGQKVKQLINVGVSEFKTSVCKNDVLATYSLGSCIAIAAYCPSPTIGGLLHYLLPSASLNPQRAYQKPSMYGDIAIPNFFNRLYELGAQKNSLIVKVIGGASAPFNMGFNVGERNYTILKQICSSNNIRIEAEDVGGIDPKTVFLEMDTGNVTITSRGYFYRI